MKFELNDYHRNVSDQEFILDVQETAKRLGKDTLTGEEYSLHGKYHSSTLTRRFGSWKKVLLRHKDIISNMIFQTKML